MPHKSLPIVECEITPLPNQIGDPLPEVRAFFEDGTAEVLFRYYPD